MALSLPRKYQVIGVGVSATTYSETVETVMQGIRKGQQLVVTAFPVHGVVIASQDQALKAKVNSFDIITPDGHPVRWAMNILYDTRLTDRVYGPELMLRLCRRVAEEGIGIYLYGSYPHVLDGLHNNLIRMCPNLLILGWESPPFRPLTPKEDHEAVAKINESGAQIVFLGLGCPLQDNFAFDHRDKIKATQICVGAAFDFHAGSKKMAPPWMQRNGLEWLFRLKQEPKRLWRRYLYFNSAFLVKITDQIIRQKFFTRYPLRL
ncbi:MAG: WecB/TagA/CpsF family glycosyltransferase [Deltaproteobacteria bacterium]|nr:WecB/TagA/CpsF family glycosyltransferase [Deltaproteobacteria bacterium]